MPDPEQNTIQQVIKSHANRYPDWKVDDLYKLIYQAAMGNEHAITDGIAARNWLKNELTTMGVSPQEPLLDTISPDGAILRVHLRPFQKAGLNAELLLQAFLDSTTVFWGSKEKLIEFMESAVKMAEGNELAFSVPKLMDYFSKMRKLDLRAVHHSPAYSQAYKPAYRVVAKVALPEIFLEKHSELNK